MAERTCMVPECERTFVAKGMCHLHWQRAHTGVPLDKLIKKPTGGPCEVNGCEKRARKRGWCQMHYDRWLKHGDVETVKTPVKGVCALDHCEREHYAFGYCHAHGRRAKLGKPLKKPFRPRKASACAWNGCERGGRFKGYCGTHRDRVAYLNDPEPFKARVALRRQRAGTLSSEDREISQAYRHAIRNDPCAYCGDPVAIDTDHYFPLAKGGTNHWWNLTRACEHCNRVKWARCGTWFKLRRGTVESARSVPALPQAGQEHRRVPKPPNLGLVGGSS